MEITFKNERKKKQTNHRHRHTHYITMENSIRKDVEGNDTDATATQAVPVAAAAAAISEEQKTPQAVRRERKFSNRCDMIFCKLADIAVRGTHIRTKKPPLSDALLSTKKKVDEWSERSDDIDLVSVEAERRRLLKPLRVYLDDTRYRRRGEDRRGEGTVFVFTWGGIIQRIFLEGKDEHAYRSKPIPSKTVDVAYVSLLPIRFRSKASSELGIAEHTLETERVMELGTALRDCGSDPVEFHKCANALVKECWVFLIQVYGVMKVIESAKMRGKVDDVDEDDESSSSSSSSSSSESEADSDDDDDDTKENDTKSGAASRKRDRADRDVVVVGSPSKKRKHV